MGCVYIPPKNTKYSSTDAFSDIENEMFNLVKNCEHVSLLGDFNAKSGKLSDYAKPDEELLDIFDLHEDIDLISYMYDYENLLRANIPLNRKRLCTGKPNTYGHCLLDLCRKNNIHIVNGRVGKDGLVGERTCKDASLVDYFSVSSK